MSAATQAGSVVRVQAVCVGTVAELRGRGRSEASGIAKSVVPGPVRIESAGLAGDEQADLVNHGGPDKAVLAYPSEHYRDWQTQVGPLAVPSFGENLSISGLLESQAVLGSVFTVGTAVLQVSQPRRPCYKLARHNDIGNLTVLSQQTGRTGFYLRVISPGVVRAGDLMQQVSQPAHGITAAEVNRVLNLDRGDEEGARRLLEHPQALPARWVEQLRRRLQGEGEDQAARLHGAGR